MATQTPAGPATTPTDTRRVEPGATARAALPDADYADAFRIGATTEAPAGTWARRAFEGGPPLPRRVFRVLAWQGLLGMHLAREGTPGHVAGWTVLDDEPERVVMHVDSWMLTGRLVTETAADGTTITTLLRFDRPIGRAVWAAAGALHRAMMPGVLRAAARRVARDTPGAVPRAG